MPRRSHAGAQCSAGGIEVQFGLDNGDPSGTARNNLLESGEVDGDELVCNGEAGSGGGGGGAAGMGPVLDAADQTLGTLFAVSQRELTILTSEG